MQIAEKREGIDSVYKRFLELERRLDLFSFECDGVRVWELVRFSVFSKLLESIGFGQAHTVKRFDKEPLTKKIALLFRVLKDAIFHNPFRIRDVDLLFFGHPRRKLMEDGLYWDIYTDPVIDSLKGYKTATIESYYLFGHLRPAKTRELYYDGMVILRGYIRRIFFPFRSCEQLRAISKIATDAILSAFNTRIDVNAMMHDKMLKRHCRLPVCSSLLRKLRPKAIIVVVGYGKETMIEAAKKLHIPVVELQHGVIHRYHMAYSFENGSKKMNFPDYIFTFGRFWAENFNYPIDKSKVLPVGYPYLENKISKIDTTSKEDVIVFISQGTIGNELSRFAIETAELFKERIRIVYKLHPGEYDRWENEYPWLRSAYRAGLLDVVSCDRPDLYELLARSKWVAGVSSTVLYEALAMGCVPFIVELPGCESMSDLIEKNHARLIRSPNDVASFLNIASFPKDYYFSDDWQRNLHLSVERIIGMNRSARLI